MYLGIDLSTQSCKATLIDPTLTVVNSATVNFEDDLPQYHTNGGILIYEGGVVVSPTLMVSHYYYDDWIVGWIYWSSIIEIITIEYSYGKSVSFSFHSFIDQINWCQWAAAW